MAYRTLLESLNNGKDTPFSCLKCSKIKNYE
nr:MAG TPA: hypothetical protein [Caudoviricetes sp.]